jgi:hypothetical protein
VTTDRARTRCHICGEEARGATRVNGATVCSGKCHKQAVFAAKVNRRRPAPQIRWVSATEIVGPDRSPLPATEAIADGSDPLLRDGAATPTRRRHKRQEVVIATNDMSWDQREEEVRRRVGWNCGGCMQHFPPNEPYTKTARGFRCQSCL